MIRNTETLTMSASYTMDKWASAVLNAVKKGAPRIAELSDFDLEEIVGLCAGWNIIYKELFDGSIDSEEWAASVTECSFIVAYLCDYKSIFEACKGISDKDWVERIKRARNGQYGEIPGTNISINIDKQEVKVPVSGITAPGRVIMKTERKRNHAVMDAKTYLMTDSNTGYTKIGRSVNPRIREKTLQSEKPTITLFKVCDKDIELSLHDRYAAKRIRGEWFNLSEADITNICTEYEFHNHLK